MGEVLRQRSARARESTGTDKEQEARRFLKVREGKAASGEPVLRRADRVRYDEAAADLRRHYETTGERDLDEADGRLAHLKRHFTGGRIATIGSADVTAYAQRRQQAGAANGTINRELAILARMLRIAYKANKLMRLPVIEKLKEAGARQGFFEPAQYEAVRRRLGPDLQAALTIAYAFGWRMQSEGAHARTAPARPQGRDAAPGPRHDEERRRAHPSTSPLS